MRCQIKVLFKALKTAIDCGYRLIDTAAYYENEAAIGTNILGFLW